MRQRAKIFKAFALLAIGSQSVQASAFDWNVTTSVNVVEPSYMPDRVVFSVSSSVGSCPVGSWLTWQSKGPTDAAKAANAQAVLSVLMTAMLAHRQVRIYGMNSGCKVEHMHLL